jgi:hypothetical protein
MRLNILIEIIFSLFRILVKILFFINVGLLATLLCRFINQLIAFVGVYMTEQSAILKYSSSFIFRLFSTINGTVSINLFK